ncbi:ferredoxin [Streptacidiphilus sp. 4-A2]|nr:ferredoxin [Streptacidiphilus sp. 4-A2]
MTRDLTVSVDAGLCLGSGVCVASAPDVFHLVGGVVAVREDADTSDDVLIEEVAGCCPTEAISIRRD